MSKNELHYQLCPIPIEIEKIFQRQLKSSTLESDQKIWSIDSRSDQKFRFSIDLLNIPTVNERWNSLYQDLTKLVKSRLSMTVIETHVLASRNHWHWCLKPIGAAPFRAARMTWIFIQTSSRQLCSNLGD